MYRLLILIIFLTACSSSQKIVIPARPAEAINGTDFYKKVIPLTREERESIVVKEVLSGNIPSFLKYFVRIATEATDSLGIIHKAVYYVSPDYLSVGSNADFARIPLTPVAAQKIADGLHCFLPTRKMVNDIYRQSVVKLEPIPLYQYRDSALMFWQHHLMIEGQRKLRRGLIAGIKKDVVISGKISRDPKPHRVAIYGWHTPEGKPIQPLYTGHVDWYVDYSHGIRLVYSKIKVDGRWMEYEEILKNPLLKGLLCDEEYCDFYKYEWEEVRKSVSQ
ncbi:hypothetical protein D3H65_32110 [Paraflavitalea soli]|uniref:Uncharacterized protein n=1 Tax=Paraflavitalea soli TaxID=2315862 RepID=A0A3B7N2T0_9BACT|nr:hypothetical protein [Paraflavitalea soli]AXY78355.1 hypothetical protein D3H65_32110 [Paraflavitalea soli]